MKNSLFAYALLFLSGTAASCFNPSIAGVTITCDPAVGGCPEGQECSTSGVCTAPGQGDGGVNPNADLAPPSTLEPSEGCPNGGLGFDVTAAGRPKVYACPAKFTNKAGQTADAQCKAPYTLCANANNVDFAACTRAGKYQNGFFIANVPANKKFNGGPASCGAPGGGEYAIWGGCGRTGTTINCMGFTTALECSFNGTFTCAGGRIGDAMNNDGASGVLCCKP